VKTSPLRSSSLPASPEARHFLPRLVFFSDENLFSSPSFAFPFLAIRAEFFYSSRDEMVSLSFERFGVSPVILPMFFSPLLARQSSARSSSVHLPLSGGEQLG